MAISINGFPGQAISSAEAIGLGKCFEAYGNESPSDDILEIGFNENSGYVYIALENGVTIASMLGNDVEYIVTDFESGEEYFCDTYDEALDQLESF